MNAEKEEMKNQKSVKMNVEIANVIDNEKCMLKMLKGAEMLKDVKLCTCKKQCWKCENVELRKTDGKLEAEKNFLVLRDFVCW